VGVKVHQQSILMTSILNAAIETKLNGAAHIRYL